MLDTTSTTLLASRPSFSNRRADVTVARVLGRDIETRSRAVLRKVGAAKYAADKTTKVLCVTFAVDDGPVQLWPPGDPVPPEFFEAAADPSWIVYAHNDAFETAIEQHVLVPQYSWPIVPLERHRCTMAACLALGLPAKLGAAADALELRNRKDAAGERLMHQMSRPRKPRQGEDPTNAYWFDDDDRLQRLYGYCKQDFEVARELYNRLPPLSATEQALWALGGQINARGFHVDRGYAGETNYQGEVKDSVLVRPLTAPTKQQLERAARKSPPPAMDDEITF
jgi:DNA polymerase